MDNPFTDQVMNHILARYRFAYQRTNVDYSVPFQYVLAQYMDWWIEVNEGENPPQIRDEAERVAGLASELAGMTLDLTAWPG